MTKMSIRGISLNIKVIGHGFPLVLMHGGPGADLYSMMSFRRLANQFTLVFYDHRCNGRSDGAEVTSMTMENLTADADALRQALGFEKNGCLDIRSVGWSPWNMPYTIRKAYLTCCLSILAAISVGRRKMHQRSWHNAGSAQIL